MRWLNDLPIRWKIHSIVLLAGAPVAILSAIALLSYDHATFRSKLTRDSETTARMVGTSCTAALLFEDRREATRILATLSENPAIRLGVLFDAGGRIFASHEKAMEPASGLPPHGMPNDTSLVRDGWLHVKRAIRVDGETAGVLYLRVSLQELQGRTLGALVVILVVLAIALAGFSSIMRKLDSAVTGPLLGLSRMVQDVTSDESFHRRIAPHGKDEVGVVVGQFNGLLQKLEERDRILQHHREWLEIRVEERTRELREAKEAAEQASRAKSEFLANMSHELRTPLHGILSFSELGVRRSTGRSDTKLTEYYERIHASGTRLLHLVTDLLDLAKLEAGRHQFQFGDHTVDEVVATLIDGMAPEFARRGLTLEFRERERISVLMDRDAILQVMRNVLGNALRFSPEGGTVSVAVRGTGEGVLIVVDDRGPGIPEDELTAIFEKFVESKRTKTQAGGTGLGLAIGREIVTGHGGHIWAENRPGGGARVCIELPAHPPASHEQSVPPPAAA